MGIPSYFSHIIKKYGSMIKHIAKKNKIDNLYLDSNSIIYEILHSLDYENYSKDSEYEETLIRLVCEKIVSYIEIMSPKQRVFIAFDGVAPVAKLKQQKTRRYRSKFIDHVTGQINESVKPKWDSAAITPGTPFMQKLDSYATQYFARYSLEHNISVIYSGSNIHGEGEHKLFQYIRKHHEYHKNTHTYIYGLDSDLIMLCLNHLHISKHIYLYREAPQFASCFHDDLDANDHCYLDIHELMQGIVKELGIYDVSKCKIIKDKISDYIFISFMMGNDFMPHFPALNIRTNGISIILETYKEVINTNQSICHNNNIQWSLFKKFVEELAKHEHSYLLNEYKIRSKWESRPLVMKTSEDKLQKFNELPFRSRQVEHFIDPYSSGWQDRYYQQLFHIEVNKTYKKEICMNYIEGMEWTLKYYSTGCVNYRWCYHYDYPPLLEDLVRYIPTYRVEMIDENYSIISNHTQLSYVLPLQSLHMLPDKLYSRLMNKYPDHYKQPPKFEWSFCKYFWECHPVMKYFDIDELESFVTETK